MNKPLIYNTLTRKEFQIVSKKDKLASKLSLKSYICEN